MNERLGVAVALAVGFNACAQPEEVAISELLDTAVIESRSRRIDFGEPGARRHMISGWSWNESGFEPPTSFVWSVGAESRLEFFSPDGAATAATVRLAPHRFDDGPPAVVVALNGEPVTTLELASGLNEYPLALDPVAAGGNVLSFAYSKRRKPDAAGEAADRRQIAVAWDELRFGRGAPIGGVRPGEQIDELVIPYGTSLALFEPLPADSRLALDRVRASDPHGRLLVRGIDAAGQVVAEHELRTRARRRDVELCPVTEAIGLTLTAVSDDPDLEGEVALLRPTLLLPVTEPPPPPVVPPPPAAPPHIIVYLVDTLRADHLGAYGYDRPTSPRLDAFAADAVLFERTIAQSPWTRPSVASIFTGVTPRSHQVNGRGDALAAEVQTLAEQLRDAGYQTAAFITNANVYREYGMDQGFETFNQWGEELRSDRVNDLVLEWIDGRGDDPRPLFLYVHTMDPHAPYAPVEPFRSKFAADVDLELGTIRRLNLIGARGPHDGEIEGLIDLYDAEIAENDDRFGRFLDELERRDLYDSSLIVFTSDHGEEFWEHGSLQHAKSLYDEVVRVPLVVRFPGVGSRRVAHPVQHVDIHRTALAYAGVDADPRHDGRDLRLALAESPEARFLLSYIAIDTREGVMIERGSDKLIELTIDGFDRARELYDTTVDPGETANRIGRERPLAWWLRSGIAAERSRPVLVENALEVEVDEGLARQLRALGYMN